MSALMLRLIACVTMLIDHIGYVTGDMGCRIVGRIAFLIFAFLICNGFRHTSNRSRYALRLGIFALISQVPFTLFCYGDIRFSHWNVLLTLLLGLLCIWAADELRQRPRFRWAALLPAIFVCGMYFFGVISSDYSERGILTVLVFYFFNGKKWWQRAMTVAGAVVATLYDYIFAWGVVVAKMALGREVVTPQLGQWQLYQLFSLGALLFIFLYNGKKGNYPENPVCAKLLQYGFYAFYPVHMLILWLIRVL